MCPRLLKSFTMAWNQSSSPQIINVHHWYDFFRIVIFFYLKLFIKTKWPIRKQKLCKLYRWLESPIEFSQLFVKLLFELNSRGYWVFSIIFSSVISIFLKNKWRMLNTKRYNSFSLRSLSKSRGQIRFLHSKPWKRYSVLIRAAYWNASSCKDYVLLSGESPSSFLKNQKPV